MITVQQCNREENREIDWDHLTELLDVEKMPQARMIAGDETKKLEYLLEKVQRYQLIAQRLATYERTGELFDFWEALISFIGIPWPDEVERPIIFYELVKRLQKAFDDTTNEVALSGSVDGETKPVT